MFDGDFNVHLGGEFTEFHYPNLTVMHGVNHTVYSFSNDVSKIPIVNKIITAHK